MNEDLTAILLTASGAFISIFVYILLSKITNKTIRLFQLYSWSQDVLKLFLRMFSVFLCVVIFLLFLRRALAVIELAFTVKFIELILLNLGRYFSAALIILFGAYISKKFNNQLKETNKSFNQYIHLLGSLIINTAFILTGLTVIGIDIVVFLEVYKIVLLMLGLTLALIVGIPLGIYLSNKLNKRKLKKV